MIADLQIAQHVDYLAIAHRAADRLYACQLPSGAVIYEVDSLTGAENNRRYNMVRMAGVAYSLAWVANRFPSQKSRLASSQAIDFLLRSCELQPKGFYVGEYSFEDGLSSRGKLGATALLALALILSPERARYQASLDRLIETILRCQTAAGALWGFIGEENLAGQRYASGEALLALVRYHETAGEIPVLAAAQRAFAYYLNYWRFDSHQGMILWHTDCWSRMALLPQLPPQERSLYADFVGELTAALSGKQQKTASGARPDDNGGIVFENRPGVSTSLYLEALTRAAAMYRSRGDLSRALIYEQTIQPGLAFLQKLQVSTLESTSPKLSGGFRSNLQSTSIRMDNDQHVITCCLALEETEATREPLNPSPE